MTLTININIIKIIIKVKVIIIRLFYQKKITNLFKKNNKLKIQSNKLQNKKTFTIKIQK